MAITIKRRDGKLDERKISVHYEATNETSRGYEYYAYFLDPDNSGVSYSMQLDDPTVKKIMNGDHINVDAITTNISSRVIDETVTVPPKIFITTRTNKKAISPESVRITSRNETVKNLILPSSLFSIDGLHLLPNIETIQFYNVSSTTNALGIHMDANVYNLKNLILSSNIVHVNFHQSQDHERKTFGPTFAGLSEESFFRFFDLDTNRGDAGLAISLLRVMKIVNNNFSKEHLADYMKLIKKLGWLKHD